MARGYSNGSEGGGRPDRGLVVRTRPRGSVTSNVASGRSFACQRGPCRTWWCRLQRSTRFGSAVGPSFSQTGRGVSVAPVRGTVAAGEAAVMVADDQGVEQRGRDRTGG